VPSAANGGSTLNYSWTGAAANEPFNATSWTSGATGVGFGTSGVGLNLQASMLNLNASAFVRLPFVVSRPTNFSLLTLRMKYDDGFVAWINGVEFARANAPQEDLAWDSAATTTHAAATFETMSFGFPATSYERDEHFCHSRIERGGQQHVVPHTARTHRHDDCRRNHERTLLYAADTRCGESWWSNRAGPGIADVKHSPNLPLENDNLVVTARVFPTANPIANVTLYYRVMFNTEVSLAMFDDGAHGDGLAGDGVYGATIPASASTSGQMVRYYLRAQDNVGLTSRLPVFTDPASTAEYLGTVVNPNYVTSAIPVVHLFAPASVLQPGPTTSQTGADSQAGGRVSLYFDGNCMTISSCRSAATLRGLQQEIASPRIQSRASVPSPRV